MQGTLQSWDIVCLVMQVSNRDICGDYVNI